MLATSTLTTGSVDPSHHTKPVTLASPGLFPL